MNLASVANQTSGERREVTDIGAYIEYSHPSAERPFHQLDEFAFVGPSPHPSLDSLTYPQGHRNSWQRMAFFFSAPAPAENASPQPYLSADRKWLDSSL